MPRPTLAEFARLVRDKDAFELHGDREEGGGRRVVATVERRGLGFLVALPGQGPVSVTTAAEARALLTEIGLESREDWGLSF